MSVDISNSCFEATKQSDGTYVFHALLLINGQVCHFQRDSSLKWSFIGFVGGGASIAPTLGALWKLDFAGAKADYKGSLALITNNGSPVPYLRPAFTTNWSQQGVLNGAATGACIVQQAVDEWQTGDNNDWNIFDSSALILEGSQVVHYNLSGDDKTWLRGAVVSTIASAPPALIVSAYRAPDDQAFNNFEALILEGNNLVDYWCNCDSLDPAQWSWHRGPVITDKATGPACMVESLYRADASKPGNFEVLVPEGRNLVHYWRNNSVADLPWAFGTVVMSSCTGPASMLVAGYGHSGCANFEALVSDNGNIYHYYRDNTQSNTPWIRDVIITE